MLGAVVVRHHRTDEIKERQSREREREKEGKVKEKQDDEGKGGGEGGEKRSRSSSRETLDEGRPSMKRGSLLERGSLRHLDDLFPIAPLPFTLPAAGAGSGAEHDGSIRTSLQRRSLVGTESAERGLSKEEEERGHSCPLPFYEPIEEMDRASPVFGLTPRLSVSSEHWRMAAGSGQGAIARNMAASSSSQSECWRCRTEYLVPRCHPTADTFIYLKGHEDAQDADAHHQKPYQSLADVKEVGSTPLVSFGAHRYHNLSWNLNTISEEDSDDLRSTPATSAYPSRLHTPHGNLGLSSSMRMGGGGGGRTDDLLASCNKILEDNDEYDDDDDDEEEEEGRGDDEASRPASASSSSMVTAFSSVKRIAGPLSTTTTLSSFGPELEAKCSISGITKPVFSPSPPIRSSLISLPSSSSASSGPSPSLLPPPPLLVLGADGDAANDFLPHKELSRVSLLETDGEGSDRGSGGFSDFVTSFMPMPQKGIRERARELRGEGASVDTAAAGASIHSDASGGDGDRGSLPRHLPSSTSWMAPPSSSSSINPSAPPSGQPAPPSGQPAPPQGPLKPVVRSRTLTLASLSNLSMTSEDSYGTLTDHSNRPSPNNNRPSPNPPHLAVEQEGRPSPSGLLSRTRTMLSLSLSLSLARSNSIAPEPPGLAAGASSPSSPHPPSHPPPPPHHPTSSGGLKGPSGSNLPNSRNPSLLRNRYSMGGGEQGPFPALEISYPPPKVSMTQRYEGVPHFFLLFPTPFSLCLLPTSKMKSSAISDATPNGEGGGGGEHQRSLQVQISAGPILRSDRRAEEEEELEASVRDSAPLGSSPASLSTWVPTEGRSSRFRNAGEYTSDLFEKLAEIRERRATDGGRSRIHHSEGEAALRASHGGGGGGGGGLIGSKRVQVLPRIDVANHQAWGLLQGGRGGQLQGDLSHKEAEGSLVLPPL